jgi:hypothetical protein
MVNTLTLPGFSGSLDDAGMELPRRYEVELTP